VGIVRGEDGALEVGGIALPQPAGTAAEAKPKAQAWSYAIAAIQVDDLGFAWVDRSLRTALAYDLTLDATLQDLISGDPKPIRFEADVQAAQGGSLRAEGTASQDFSAASIRVNVDGLAL